MSKSIKYVLLRTIINISDQKAETYGIGCLEDGLLIRRIDDISPDGNVVEKLVSDCNELSLDPLHVEDIAEDYVQ